MEITKAVIPSAKPLNLVSKLVCVMAAIDHVEKLGQNTSQNYAYMKASDIARAIRKGLIAQNVLMTSEIISERTYTIPAREGNPFQAIDIKVRYTFYDGDGDTSLSIVGIGTGADKGDKAVYKAHTGALKYALRNTFLVPDESDPEADAALDRAVEEAKHGRVEKPKRNFEVDPKSQAVEIEPGSDMDAEPTEVFITTLAQRKTQKGVVFLNLKWNQLELNCWDTALFPYLLMAHAKKLAIELAFEPSKDPRYPAKVTSIFKVGRRQFENNVPMRDVNEDPNNLSY